MTMTDLLNNGTKIVPTLSPCRAKNSSENQTIQRVNDKLTTGALLIGSGEKKYAISVDEEALEKNIKRLKNSNIKLTLYDESADIVDTQQW